MKSADSELFSIAQAVAEAAGALLLRERPVILHAQAKSSPTDAVTEMDKRAETLIVTMLSEARPHDGVLGEEGANRPTKTNVRWIVDPLDGTVNYLYGLPLWSVSIAAEVDGAVCVGVVDVPALGRRYAAVRGSGATCATAEGVRPLAASAVTDLGMSLVATGFGYASEGRARQATIVADLLPRVRDIRRLGSAALDLCLVGDGQLDAYYETGLNPWDVAAGALIAQEAGARIRGAVGAWPDGGMALAAAPGIFSAMEETLGLRPY